MVKTVGQGYRINVRNLKVALVSKNDTEGYEIGELKPVAGLMTIGFVPIMASGQLFGDGEVAEDLARLTGATVKLDANKIPLNIRGMITGSKYEKGILDLATTDIPPEIALYCETEASNKSKEQMWFLCGKAQPFGVNAKQQEGNNITYSTDSITIGCKPRKLDKKVARLADTDMEDFEEGASEKLALHPDMKDVTATTQSTEQTTTP